MKGPQKSRNGMLMYRQLPEEYRYRDNRPDGEQGDLEAYLDGIGVLLDDIRETLEQSYADAFSAPADNGREIQPWLVPYLAELVDAELLAPDPVDRNEELNATVGWYKGKGTLGTLDSIADTLGEVETVVVEGWTRTLTTPRQQLPPFSSARAGDQPDPARLPLGTPDLRYVNRAVIDPDESYAPRSFRPLGREPDGGLKPRVYFRALAPRGAPAFPGSYDDVAARTPDLRRPAVDGSGPHPRRVDVHVQQPEGFFTTDLPVVEPDLQNWPETLLRVDPDTDAPLQIDPAALLVGARPNGGAAPARFVLKGDISIESQIRVHFTDVLIDGTLSVAPGVTEVRLTRCAIRTLRLRPGNNGALRVTAVDCLFETVDAPSSQLQAEFVTVLGDTQVQVLKATDCLFVGAFMITDPTSIVRFSRLPPDAILPDGFGLGPSNTVATPRFAGRVGEAGAPLFGKPGSGVLASSADPVITAGAEDAGELGAYHHLYLAAKLRAIRRKLEQFLPVGQFISVAYDERLSVPPANQA